MLGKRLYKEDIEKLDLTPGEKNLALSILDLDGYQGRL